MQEPPVVFTGRAPVGAWRSLVAHQHGALGVVGSNPAAPTISPIDIQLVLRGGPEQALHDDAVPPDPGEPGMAAVDADLAESKAVMQG
jgi:hypothetical protein